MLYLSIDAELSDSFWRTTIKDLNLSGHHIRASKKLYDDVVNLFWKGEQVGIPRYVLVNNKGEIVENNAFTPSEKEKLYQQIASHL